jgi:hypothetical protein
MNSRLRFVAQLCHFVDLVVREEESPMPEIQEHVNVARVIHEQDLLRHVMSLSPPTVGAP